MKDSIISALKANARKSPMLDRAILMVGQVDMSGRVFSFFDPNLDNKQLQRITTLFQKAGVIEVARGAISKERKTGYRLTTKFLPQDKQGEIMKARTGELEDLITDMDEKAEKAAAKKELEAEFREMFPTDEAFKEYINTPSEYQRKVNRDNALEALKKSRSKSVRFILRALKEGSKTRSQMLEMASSASSLDRLLNAMITAELIKTEGARRSNMVYSLYK